MNAYILITGVMFALIVLVHPSRVGAEGLHILTQPLLAVTSILSLVLMGWSVAVFRQWPSSDQQPGAGSQSGPRHRVLSFCPL
jgi:hypothetical protein